MQVKNMPSPWVKIHKKSSNIVECWYYSAPVLSCSLFYFSKARRRSGTEFLVFNFGCRPPPGGEKIYNVYTLYLFLLTTRSESLFYSHRLTYYTSPSLSLSHTHTHTHPTRNKYMVSLQMLDSSGQLCSTIPTPTTAAKTNTRSKSKRAITRHSGSQRQQRRSRSTVPAHEMALPWAATACEHFQVALHRYACVAGRCGPTRGTQRRRDPQEARILAHFHKHQASRQHSRKSLVDCASRPSLRPPQPRQQRNQPHNRLEPACRT